MKLNGSHSVLILDLFAGAGRFSLGFKLAGHDVVGGVETDKWARALDAKVIIANTRTFPTIFLSTLFVAKMSIDIIIGGPPCQGFSARAKLKTL